MMTRSNCLRSASTEPMRGSRRAGGRLLPFGLTVLLGSTAQVAAAQDLSTREIARTAEAATVTIHTLDSSGESTGEGSGFFIRADGVFVTNYHVVEDAEQLRVHVSSGATYEEVYVLATDRERDLALLRIPVDDAPVLRLGSDTAALMGDPVYAMGNPLGMERSFSDGLLSAQRTIDGISYLQITAPISPGSSGGPVMNSQGEVIGVATGSMTSGQNLNLAVPVSYLRPLLEQGQAPLRFAAHLVPSEYGGMPGSDVAPESGETSDRYLQQAIEQVDLAGEMLMAEYGMRRSHGLNSGSLREGELDRQELQLSAGTKYVFIGACDVDCRDLDLGLTEGGSLLVSDTAHDDFPVLEFTPTRTGSYMLVASMVRCSAEPCRYAAGVFAR